jgi:hypothetical protein
MKQDLRLLALQGACAIGGVAVALVVVMLARGAIVLFPPAPPEGYVVTRSEHYTLYATSAEAIRDGEEEVRHARRAFRRYFGADAREIVVFLADRPADFRGVDLEPFKKRGAGFLPFVTRRYLESAPSTQQQPAPDRAAAPETGGDAPRVLGVIDVGRPFPGGIQAGDVVAVLNGPAAGMDSAARFIHVVPPGGAARVSASREDRSAKGPSGQRFHLDPSARFLGEAGVLAHEACHDFIAGYADELVGGRGTVGDGYGHGALPDWFDEMAATLCESPASKERRRMHLRRKFDAWIPLAEFARMGHPITPERLARLLQVGGASDGLPVHHASGPEVERILAGTGSTQFYAQALSLGEFIFQRGGDVALRMLARQLVAGRSLDEALREVNRAEPEIPPSLAQLEEQWLHWVTRDD